MDTTPSLLTRETVPPVPPLSEPDNWARLPIVENGEPLVLLGDEQIRVRPLYAEMGVPGAPTEIRVRAGVRDRLLLVARFLPDDMALCVFDGYRPLAVQQWLYKTFQIELAAKHPELSPEALLHLLHQFVATPNADPSCPPPHRTGGAVDVYLVNRNTGEPLPMGTEPDETRPESVTHWFERHPEEPFTTNRRLLFHALTGAGFTNYLGEWWHYDYGNQRWANCAGRPAAFYGLPDFRAFPDTDARS